MNILIVDDELLARERLAAQLEKIPGCSLVGQAGNGREALRLIAETAPDVVLLDIRMPGLDGLTVARRLAELPTPPAVIFTTAYAEHALSAFETIASGYLLKPIKAERLAEALTRIRRPSRAQLESLQQALTEHQQPERQFIIAHTRDGQLRIPVQDILYFQADQKYTTVCHLQGEVLIEESLSHLEEDLAPQFIRVHRKFLVNSTYIVGLERGDDLGVHGAQLVLRHTAQKPPVSRRRLADIRRLLFKNSTD